MKRRFYLILFSLLILTGYANAQCKIILGPVPPVLCPGNTLCVPYTLLPPNCLDPSTIRIKIKKPHDSVFCQLPSPYCGLGNCFLIPLDAPKGRYQVMLEGIFNGAPLPSEGFKEFDVDSLDFSPAPIVNIQQLAPLRPSYCPTDTVCFKIVSLVSPSATNSIQWSRNGSAVIGANDSIFCYSGGLLDKDDFSVSITKSNQCAFNGTGFSDSIPLSINKKPKIKVVLRLPGTGCEKTLNTFVAKLDSAGPDPLIIWTLVATNGRIDTLHQGINDTVYSLLSDSAKFGYRICAQVIAGRCKLKANDCFSIKACGQVFLDPPIDASACAGTVIRVPYTIIGSFLPTNVFSVQLSDSTGSFATPINIGNLTSNNPDTISALIPDNLAGANCYKIRIVSSLPVDTSDTSSCIKVFPKPIPPVTVGDSVCKSGEVTLTASTTTPGATFQWFRSPFGGNPIFTGSSWTLFITRDTTFYISTLSVDGCNSTRVPVIGIINPVPDVEAGPDRRVCIGSQIINLTPFPLGGIWSGDLPVISDVIDLSGILPGVFTLRYTVTNAIGCQTIDSFKLTVVPRPVVNAGQDKEFCQNNLPFLLVGSPAGGTWSGQSVQTDGTFIPSDAGSGTFNLIYTVTVDGCTGKDTLSVLVKPALPDYTVTTTNPSICGAADGTATLAGITTGIGFKVRWSVLTDDSLSDPTISSLTAGSYTVRITDLTTLCGRTKAFGLSDPNATPPVISGLNPIYCSKDDTVTMSVTPMSPIGTFVGTGVIGSQFIPGAANIGLNVITYSYDAGGGCTGSTSVTVRVNPSPVVNSGVPVDTACSNEAAFMLVGFSPNAPPAIWSPSPLVSPIGLVNPALAAIGNNILTISRTVGFCTSTDTKELFVYQQPIPSIIRNPLNSICQGGIVVLTASLNPGVTAIRYEWFRDNNIIPNENGVVLNATISGTYKVVVTGLGNCPGESNSLVVNFNSLPVVNVSPSGILTPCSNNPTTLMADSLAGYTFQWFIGPDSIIGQTMRSFIPQISGQYKVRIRNAQGCEQFSSFVNVTIQQSPLAPIISPPFADTCLQAGQPITVTVGASGSGLSFEWYKVGTPDQKIPGETGPVIILNQIGQFYVKVKSSNGCETKSAVLNLKQAIKITIQDTLIEKCQGENPFVVTGLNPAGCVLLHPNGTPLVNNIFDPASPGNFDLTYQCTNSNGCVSRKTVTISVRPRPLAQIQTIGSANVCQGDTVRLIVNDGIAVGYVYQLIRNGVDFGPPGVNPFIPVTVDGNYSVKVSFSSCATTSNIIQVRFRKVPVANAGADLGGCSPIVQNLNGPGVTSGGTWSGSLRVTTSGDYNSSNFIGCETLTFQVDSIGCIGTDTKIVCVDSIPDFNTMVLNASACQIADGSAWVVASDTSKYNFVWTKVGTPGTVSTQDSIKNVLPGAYTVKITTKSTACSITRPAIINSPNNLNISVLGLPDSICSNSVPFLVSGNLSGGVFTSFGNRITSDGTLDPSLPGPASDTVYYTVTLNGCVGTAIKAFKINSVPSVDAGIDQDVCFGDTIILRALQPHNINLIWVGAQVENDSLYIATDPGITTTTVTFGYTLNGCSNIDSKIIKVNQLPDFSVTTTDVTQCGSCDGTASRSIANPNNFQQTWRNQATGQIVGGSSSISNLCVGVYSVLVTNNTTACKRLENFGISGPTNINPFVCLGTVPATICQDASPITIGKCDPSATIFIDGILTDIFNPASMIPGNIGVILSYTDPNGCVGVEQKVVEVINSPIVNVSGVSPQVACTSGGTIQLTNFFPAFDAGIPENGWSVIGSAPNGFITKSGLINPGVISNDAVFQLVYTNKTGNGTTGCLDADTITFRVYRTPTANILPSTPLVEICDGTTKSFCSQSQQAGFGYNWFLGNQTSPVGFDTCLIASLSGSYTLVVNNHGCKSSPSSPILLQTKPAPIIASIGSDLIICQGASPFQIPPPNISGTFTTSGWSALLPTNPSFVSSGGVITPDSGLVGLPGNTIRFVVSNGNCPDTAFRNILILPSINSGIQVVNNATEICDGDATTLIALANGIGYSYEWTRNDIVIPGQSDDTLITSFAGIYRVRVLINGNGTCSLPSTQAVTIVVKPSPVVTISGDTAVKVCYPGALFEISSRVTFSPSDAIWTNGGNFNIINAVGNVKPDSIKADGIYPLILVKTIGTCTDRDTINIIANKIPDPAFTTSAEAICDGDAVVLTYPNPNNYPISWKLGNSVIGNSNPISVNTAGVVTLTVDNNGCTNSSTSTFTVQPNPTFDMPGSSNICKNGLPVLFQATNLSPGLGRWTGLGIDNIGQFNPQSNDVPASGPDTLTYRRTSEFGCITQKSFILTIDPVPEIDLTADRSVIEVFGPAILSATGGTKFEWSPSLTLSVPTGPTVSARPAETTTYTVKVTTDKGCVGEKSLEIIVDQEFKIYDGLSPNNDQQNDVWIIKNIQRFPKAQVKIFNRWGNLVFESEVGYPKPWDGTYKDNPVPPGAYYYIVDLGDPQLTPKSGSITVVR